MALSAGKLRHRIRIEELRPEVDSAGEVIQDPSTGETPQSWQLVAEVWAAIAPLSAREFNRSQAMQSDVSARITIRYRDDIRPDMRLVHPAKNKIYSIKGLLEDDDSGLEYITIPCSQGVGTGQ